MKPIRKLWPLVLALSAGLWAGAAAAQDQAGDGWFEGSESERPTLHIEGKGPYDPPPADFQSEPSVDYAAPEEASSSEAAPPEPPPEADNAEGQQRAVVEFSPYLASYGYWVADPVYGRVWVPERRVVGEGFVPYSSAGHWELTPRDEWLWASDYPFGWVTFHYGRWVSISSGGWGWVPGSAYAPAWVDFRVGVNGYVGWGPLPPYGVWRGGVFVSIGARRSLPYVYVPTNYVFSRSMSRYVVRDRYRVRHLDAQSYRYRSPRVSGVTRVHYPTPAEARIPARSLPRERVVARPRLSSEQLNVSRSRFRQNEPSRGSGRVPNYARHSDYGRQDVVGRGSSRPAPRSGWDARRDAAGPNPRWHARGDGRGAAGVPDNAWGTQRRPDPSRGGPSRAYPQGSNDRGGRYHGSPRGTAPGIQPRVAPRAPEHAPRATPSDRRGDGRGSRGASGGNRGGSREHGRDSRGNAR